MTRTQEIRPDIDDGIDRKVLAQLRARFLQINQGRLLRAMEALSSRQQLVLKLLPLLLQGAGKLSVDALLTRGSRR